MQSSPVPAGPVRVRRYLLTLADGVYFATREMGTLVETERYLHNYALSYALFNDSIIRSPFFAPSHRPTYAHDLGMLNDAGVYVTPARPLAIQYQLVTYKIAQTTYHQRAQRFESPNYPRNIGRVKELAPGSSFEGYVFGADQVVLPRWIRLGKWMSKTEVRVLSDERVQPHEGDFACRHALNPLDIGGARVGVFNLISMPPVSLIVNAQLHGSYVTVGQGSDEVHLPWGMRYTFPPDAAGDTLPARQRKGAGDDTA
jgi:CRISPR-associated protein Csc1